MSATYPQPQILWQLCPLPSQLLSCIISTLRRNLCEREILKMPNIRGCTGSAPTSAPPCRSAPLSKIHSSLESRSYRYTDTGSDMPTTPIDDCTNLGKSRFLMRVGQLLQPISWMAFLTLKILQVLNPTPDWTDTSPVSLKPAVSRTLTSNEKRPPPLALSTPSWLQWPPPPTPKPNMSPTWSN